MSACGGDTSESPTSTAPVTPSDITVDYDISEKLYVTSINDIYTNTEDYLGKVLRLEGMYTAESYGANIYYYVYRTGPGCCGNDGAMCGFEFIWNGEMPKDNDWIRVTGELEEYYEGKDKYLHIICSSLEILDVRGAEVVGN